MSNSGVLIVRDDAAIKGEIRNCRQLEVYGYVEGDIAAVVELYASNPEAFGTATVTFEIAQTADSPALVTTPADIVTAGRTTARAAQAVIGARALPPGRYVVRARITRDRTPAGLLTRPFVLNASSSPPAALPIAPPIAIPPFDRTLTLAPALISDFLSTLERRSPALKSALTEARAGRYTAGALEALSEGDQDVAAFLRGLDFYIKGQFEQAATQLNVSAGPRREFFPGAFFLGGAYAALGRDRDAAAVWQMAIGSDARPSLVYQLFADSRFRDGQPQSVVDVLLPAWQKTPADDGIARRLGTALTMTGKHAEALPVFEQVMGSLRDLRENPEWRYVEEGPIWRGRRVLRW